MDPERLGRFTVTGRLGEGGMGTVYAAVDPDTGSQVALKVLSASFVTDEEKFRRFEQEVVALSRVTHHGVVRLLGPLQRDGTRVFFPMELLEGETLAARLRREGALPVPAALSVFRSLVESLGAAHAAGVVHRDVKPSNILLAKDGLKVTDFGLARMEDLSRLTTTGQLMGTLDYMSPEQCEGRKIDARTDLYSAGIVLFEMLAGRPPFRHESPGATLKGHLQDVPPRVDTLRADLPPGLADLVDRLLAKRPEERHRDAGELLDALDAVRDPSRTATFHRGAAPADRTTEALTVMPLREPAPRRRGLLALGAAAAAALALAVALYLLLAHRRSEAPPSTPPEQARSPARATPEEVLAAAHGAIEKRDYAAFAACFEPPALSDHFSAEPEMDFALRAGGIADFAYRMEVPMRGASAGDVTFRTGASAALARVLGLNPSMMLRVGFRPHAGGFRIAGVGEETPGGRRDALSRRPEVERRMFLERMGEMFANFDEMAPMLLPALVRASRLPAEEIQRRLKEARSRGEIDFQILEDETTIMGDAARVVVRSQVLARVLSLADDRMVFDLARNPPDRRFRLREIRPHEK